MAEMEATDSGCRAADERPLELDELSDDELLSIIGGACDIEVGRVLDKVLSSL